MESTLNKKRNKIIDIYKKSGIYFTDVELSKIEIADFDLNDFENIGLGVIIYINTEKVCAKELALLPLQICPQHKHPMIGGLTGKEETFRCRWGTVYLYVEGENTKQIQAKIPEKYYKDFTVFKEIILNPGDQHTLYPETWHWFQGGT